MTSPGTRFARPANHRHFPALVFMCLAAAGPVTASQPVSLHEVFPYQAEITPQGPGLHRLDLPPQVLEHCRSDLSDLRIFDASGQQVPYLVDNRRAEQEAQVLHQVRAEVVAVDRRRQPGKQRPTRYQEVYTLAVPPLPAEAGAWDLVVDSRRPELVARLDIVAELADGSTVTILDGASLFRLATPPARRLRFPVTAAQAVRLQVTVTGEDQGYLEPGFTFEALRSIRYSKPPSLVLEQLQVRHLHDRTVVVLERPRGLVPSRLRLATTTGAFHRRVTVWDEGADAAPSPLGQETLLRVDAIVPVEVTEIALAPARADRLRVVIENRDSPPLEAIELSAVVPQPVLFFSLGQGQRSATLRFGGARAHRPDYDLAALAPPGRAAGHEAVDRALAVWDPGRSSVATLGPITDSPQYDPSPALAFAMHPGATLSPRPFSHRRQLQAEPSPEGLARLRLQPEDLALLRADLADLRVIDSESRQWAYLLVEKGSAGTMVMLHLTRHRSHQGQSRYTLSPPVSPLLLDRLVIEPEAPFYDRSFQLLGTGEDDQQRPLASGRLVRHHGDPRPVTISLGRQRLLELELVVDDGDDAPLVLTRIEARTPLPDLYLAVPTGTYTLLLGHPDASAPRYELERVRSTVLAVPAAAIDSGAIEPNPVFSAASRLATGEGKQQALLWSVLALAVVALAGLTLRLARQERTPGSDADD